MSRNHDARRERIVSAFVVAGLALGVIAFAPREGGEPPAGAGRAPARAAECPVCRELADLRDDLARIRPSAPVPRRAKKRELELAEAAILRKAGIRIGRCFRTDAGQVRAADAEEARAAAEFLAAAFPRDGANVALEAVAETLGSATATALERVQAEFATLKDQGVLAPARAAEASLAIDAFLSVDE